MKVFHAPGTRSVRILWLLEELGLNYDIEFMKLGDPAMRAPEYLKIHPMGRVPAVQDGDVVLNESGAIVQYVLAKYGDGRMAPDVASPNFANYLQWLHFAEGMLMAPIGVIVVETILLPPDRKNQTNVDRAIKLVSRALAAVEAHLEGREYLAGEFSGADIMTGHACTVAARLGGDVSDKPNVQAYIERLEARPALQKARATEPS